MFIALILFLGSFNKPSPQTVDYVEFNRKMEGESHSYDQLIYWTWSPDYCRYHVSAYELVESNFLWPSRCGDGWLLWSGNMQVYTPIFRVTQTQRDPERDNKLLMEEARRLPPMLWSTRRANFHPGN